MVLTTTVLLLCDSIMVFFKQVVLKIRFCGGCCNLNCWTPTIYNVIITNRYHKLRTSSVNIISSRRIPKVYTILVVINKVFVFLLQREHLFGCIKCSSAVFISIVPTQSVYKKNVQMNLTRTTHRIIFLFLSNNHLSNTHDLSTTPHSIERQVHRKTSYLGPSLFPLHHATL